MMRRLHPAAPQSGIEAADVEEVSPFSPKHRKQRYREITTQVFGLVLVLGAYSVAEYNIQSSADLVNSLFVFLPTFAWVFMFWNGVGVLFDLYPDDDEVFYRLIVAVLLLAILTPAFLRLLILSTPSVRELGGTIAPLTLVAVNGLRMALLLRLITHHHVQPSLARHCRLGVISIAVGTAILLASLLAPFNPPSTMARAYVWFLALGAGSVASPIMRWYLGWER